MDKTLTFPPVVTRNSFEELLASRNDREITNGQMLLIDLQQVIFIELASLFCINSYLSHVLQCSAQFQIELPEKKAVRDFLLVWRYFESLNDIGAQPFEVYLTGRSIELLAEPQTTYSERGSDISKLEWDPDWQHGSRTKRNFFEFTSFKRRQLDPQDYDRDPSISYPVIESQRWERPLIKSVLNRHLKDATASDDISRVVIYEAISNAIRHPNASLIQTASLFADSRYSSGNRDSSNHFRICIWDNGDSIPSTLSILAQAGAPIRSHTVIPKYMSEKIVCRQKRFGDKTWHDRTPVIDEFDEVNNTKGEEGRLLMYSTFPGVSRDAPNLKTPPSPSALSETSSPWIGRGMGLYALRRVVVNQLGGSLSVRCGMYRIKFLLTPHKMWDETKATTLAEIVSYEKTSLPPFRGNLIEINIPLKPKEIEHG